MNKQKRPGTEAHCSCRRHTRQGRRRRGKTRNSSRGIQDMSPGGIKLVISSKAPFFYHCIVCQICQALSLNFLSPKPSPFFLSPALFAACLQFNNIFFSEQYLQQSNSVSFLVTIHVSIHNNKKLPLYS